MKTEFYIKFKDGTIVPVTKNVYREYKRTKWREAYRRKTCVVREISCEFMSEKGNEINVVSSQKLTEDIVIDKIMLKLLRLSLKSSKSGINTGHFSIFMI